mgnify:CR=1 FL=1
MDDLYIVCSRPLSGQYDGIKQSITVGDEVAPIPPDKHGNGFDGGMMPSGPETYNLGLIDDKWYQETMPKTLEECRDTLRARFLLKKGDDPYIDNAEPHTPSRGTFTTSFHLADCEDTNNEWEYVILDASKTLVPGF